MVISLHKKSRNREEPRNREEKWISPIFTLIQEPTVLLNFFILQDLIPFVIHYLVEEIKKENTIWAGYQNTK